MLIKVMTFVLTGVITVAYAELPIKNRCPMTVVINHTDRWTNGDQRALNRAKNRCVIVYQDAPCLKRFDKLADLRYTALCGQKRN